jgi:PKD repeat protein
VTESSTNMSTSGCNNTWSWNFGDGTGTSTSTLQNPAPYQYQSAGSYTIQLTVSNTGGTSTVSHAVTATP